MQVQALSQLMPTKSQPNSIPLQIKSPLFPTTPHNFTHLLSSSSLTNMATFTPLAFILLTLTPFLLFQAQAQTAPAPSPSGPVNLTAILEKGGQYTTLIRLLQDTQQLIQIQSQLKSNSQGFSVFAPTDNAFQNLKSGAINDLSDDQKVKLILYHITPKYYALSDLTTVSNPVRTQASDWGLNFTGQGNQVNVSTGVVTTQVNNALRQQFPLAVYQVDKVLLPEALFGDKSSAPSPKSSKTDHPSEIPSTGKEDGAPSPDSASQKDNANGGERRSVGLGMVVGIGLICMAALS